MMIDGILKVVMLLWFMSVAGYVGYVIGLSGFSKDILKRAFWNEEDDDDL